MIPDYCVPDGLASTGTMVAIIGLFSIACLVAGILIVKKSANRRSALFVLMAMVGLVATAGQLPSAQASTVKECPPGYHYDASRDHTAGSTTTDGNNGVSGETGSGTSEKPKPNASKLERFRTSEDPAKVKTTFVMKDDGSTGKTVSGEDIINWDIAKKTIRAYMNADKNGIADKKNSPYITEVTKIATEAADKMVPLCQQAKAAGKKPAAVFDADDTTLWTYDMEDGAMNFAFTPDKQQAWFDKNQMPATPGMVDAVKRMAQAGCQIIGLTGRNSAQEEYTIKNLTDVGYVDAAGKPLFQRDLYFTKFLKTDPMPEYLHKFCDQAKHKCTTVQFKAGTREHIQSDLGYTIVGNFGDQWSDLMGGREENWFKLPNATYYLPSPNLPDWEAKDREAGMAPTEKAYTVLPDGSSGKTTPGDNLPNMDIVKATIRAYYNAQDGTGEQKGQKVADKTSSPYISEMTNLTKKWTGQVAAACKASKDKGEKPVVVFDADDTTLWCYDMEEWLEFAFSAAKQDEYLRTNYHRLPAVPGMVDLIKAANQAGCTTVGLTGRSHDLREVTLRNLSEVKYDSFTDKLYFTKISSKASEQENGVKCEKEKCTTVEYKSGTRGYIEGKLGYRIIGNFGDQWSDLLGGYQDNYYKLPNPTYYLP